MWQLFKYMHIFYNSNKIQLLQSDAFCCGMSRIFFYPGMTSSMLSERAQVQKKKKKTEVGKRDVQQGDYLEGEGDRWEASGGQIGADGGRDLINGRGVVCSWSTATWHLVERRSINANSAPSSREWLWPGRKGKKKQKKQIRATSPTLSPLIHPSIHLSLSQQHLHFVLTTDLFPSFLCTLSLSSTASVSRHLMFLSTLSNPRFASHTHRRPPARSECATGPGSQDLFASRQTLCLIWMVLPDEKKRKKEKKRWGWERRVGLSWATLWELTETLDLRMNLQLRGEEPERDSGGAKTRGMTLYPRNRDSFMVGTRLATAKKIKPSSACQHFKCMTKTLRRSSVLNKSNS